MAIQKEQDSPATLTDLPIEILEEITSLLDDYALLQLGLTCKDTNTVALATFFSKHDIQWAQGVIHARGHPVETLPALRAALFVKDLKEIHYYLKPNLNQLVREVDDMRSLVARLQGVDVVALHFQNLDTWTKYDRNVPVDGMEREMWKELFSGLLDTILDKSCTELLITGGSYLHELYSPVLNPPPKRSRCLVVDKPAVARGQPIPTVQHESILQDAYHGTGEKIGLWSLKRLFRRIFHARERRGVSTEQIEQVSIPALPAPAPDVDARTKERTSRPAPSRKNKLKELQIHSDMLLQEYFFDWTRSRIGAASATLTRLSFHCIVVPCNTWRTLFRALALPCLSDFVFFTGLSIGTGSRFVDLREFLLRHPWLSTVCLYGVEPPLSLGVGKPILPMITNLAAHPNYVTHVLGSSQDNLPLLCALRISPGQRCGPYFLDYTSFDKALESIASFNFCRPIALTLEFQRYDGLDQWFASHRDLGSQSVLASLHHVNFLVIACAYDVNLSYGVVTPLEEWLALFPNVERVEFAEQPLDCEAAELFLAPDFLKRLAAACPKLKEVGVEDKFVDVKTGEEVIQHLDPEDEER